MGSPSIIDETRADEVLVYQARSGWWRPQSHDSVQPGDSYLYRGVLFVEDPDGPRPIGGADTRVLANADATFLEYARAPASDEWVLVLGEGGTRHSLLRDVPAGAQIAFQGRILDTIGTFSDGVTHVVATGEVFSRVLDVSHRTAEEPVVEATLQWPEGTTSVLTATGEHPFYVPELGKFVSLGRIEAGTMLQGPGGALVILAAKGWIDGPNEVFNLEVEGQHNYLVGAEGSPWAVLSHNAKDCSLVRFGEGPECAAGLAAQAAAAEAAGFGHGVSTMLKDRISGSDRRHRSAKLKDVCSVFPVKQTGRNPRHHTVLLPKPVTEGVADAFNDLF